MEARLRDADGKLLAPEFARATVADWLTAAPGEEPHPYLWILDNVPQMLPQDARDRVLDFWRAPTSGGRTVLTTRDAKVVGGFREEKLEELEEVDALRLLSRFRPIGDDERPAAETLMNEVGRHTRSR